MTKIDKYDDNSAEKILFDAGMLNRLRAVTTRYVDNPGSILCHLWGTRLMYLRTAAHSIAPPANSLIIMISQEWFKYYG